MSDAAAEQPDGDVPQARAVRPTPSTWQRIAARIAPYEVAIAALVSCVVLFSGLASFSLIDPWETHYGEVARRILDENDWVYLRWQSEAFRSKPVLTFWLMAAGLRALGVASQGGYSGELTEGDLPVLALRLPFAMFAALGLTMTFWMLRRLVSRRAAWLGLAALAGSPFYVLVGRQAITDIPAIACIIGALACFIVAVASDAPRRPLWKRVDAYHLFLAVAGLIIVGQALYYLVYFARSPALGPGLRVWQPGLLLAAPLVVGFIALVVLDHVVVRVTTERQVLMRWAYLLGGVSVLAKGPVGPAIIGTTCVVYLLVIEQEWRLAVTLVQRLRGRAVDRARHLTLRLSLPQGLLVIAMVAVPWHVAMYFKDGRGFIREYFYTHWFGRYGQGVFGNRGTFDYFTSQLAIGLFPLIGLIPFALAWLATRPFERSDAGRVRALIGVWAVIGFGVIAWSTTKFHHYILTAVPPLAVAVALWLDDAWRARGRSLAVAALTGVLAIALVARDLVGEQKQIIEMFVFRDDRPWPSGAPWFVDVGGPILALATIAALSTAALAIGRLRGAAIVATLGSAVAFTLWAANGYMRAAAPHWGQRELHRTYLRERAIHGVEIKYFGLRDLADDWADGAYTVETVLPAKFAAGAPMRARLIVPGAKLAPTPAAGKGGAPPDTLELTGAATDVGEHSFVLKLDAASAARIADLVARGRGQPYPRQKPWVQVDADRLIAWRLNWRGENFWSGGEIYGQTDDTRTVFDKVDNVAFLKYVKDPARAGRRFFVITESQTASALKGVLPTPRGKETARIVDTSCNKFTLLEFSQ